MKSNLFLYTSVIILVFNTQKMLAQNDTTKVLGEVVISAYQSNRSLSEVPVSVGVVGEKELQRFSSSSLLPAANMIPGVRMEERSPGSYRFAIRGSSLRSPFGVRNVKFYWNGLPLTDGGGNTYLNLLDFNSVGSMEIIKGPGASLYGAGTGGVVLLKSRPSKDNNIQLSALAGSYGLSQYSLSAQGSTEKISVAAGLFKQHSNGYRQQSEMDRLSAHIDLSLFLNSRNTLSATVFNSTLNYQTPGGLTLAQYTEDARQARPSTPTMSGAIDQKAEVKNKTTYLGLMHEVQWNKWWSTKTGVYGGLTDFNNPTIRNYESRDEKNGGLRTETQYVLDRHSWKAKFTGGAELQFFQSEVGVYGNDKGSKTSLVMSMDKLKSQYYLFFAQSEIDLPYQFFVTVGGSLSALKYRDIQSITASDVLTRKFHPEISPRIAVLKKLSPLFSVYGSVSRGFSPPTFAEALPSTGGFNADLNAERGTNYEIGLRGKLLKLLDVSLAVYDFRLRNALVTQRAADGADYYVNAGSTVQKGIESTIGWSHNTTNRWMAYTRLWTSITINDYYFKKYEQKGIDYSGNPLTGVAPNIVVAGLDIGTKPGVFLNVTANYTDPISLNDAASEYASDFVLLGAKGGYRKSLEKITFEVFGGIDNALDKKYSLGNDVNATGGRYYNVAAGRNYFGGLKIGLK